MPAKSSHEYVEEFCDTVDQLYELYQKFHSTHDIILGGDLNEDLNIDINSKRNRYLRQFISECHLYYENAGKTFTKANGVECSELDYFLHNVTPENCTKKTICRIASNVSDHHPVHMSVKCNFGKVTETNTGSNKLKPRLKWDKVDKDLYLAMVDQAVTELVGQLANGQKQTDEIVVKTCDIMKRAADLSSENKARYNAKPKLKVWTPAIKSALDSMRQKYKTWVVNGKSNDPHNQTLIAKKISKKEFRREIRIEVARRRDEEKERIMETRTRDNKLFHQLVRKNRSKGRDFIMDLNVGDICFSGEQDVLAGFQQHFQQLASESEGNVVAKEYYENVDYENKLIRSMVQDINVPETTNEEIRTAIKSINRGKSEDIYNIAIEHIVHAGENMEKLVQEIINSIFRQGKVPDLLKVGLLTPVFKNKGSKNDVTNYRGITVLPVLGKIIETVLRNRIRPIINKTQSCFQRGFTVGASPMNSALSVEESYRECKDNGLEMKLVLLDAKSAFDVVRHNNLMRRVYHAGIQDKHWMLIQSLHNGATSAVKWNGSISETFEVKQGVRQGGILSTDLYKLYINPLLERMEHTNLGTKIGNVLCNATACADDVALLSNLDDDIQILVNMSNDFANMEGYRLQPTKSVLLNVRPTASRKRELETRLELGKDEMPTVQHATHLGMIRTCMMKENIRENVDENIQKARRSAYGLFGGGFHGNSGLDPETLIHLFRTYISPLLLYGMELIIPQSAQLEQLEKFQKKMLKQLLSLPINTPDPAIFILTGILQVEAQIHIKSLSFFNNICNKPETSVEKKLARRQLAVKTFKSNSWFIAIEKILMKYNFKDCNYNLDNPMKKEKWSALVKQKIFNFWTNSIIRLVPFYSGLVYLNTTDFKHGKIHPLLRIKCRSARDVTRLPSKLKMVTGTYILQTRRAQMYKKDTESVCLLCHGGEETLQHFVLECVALGVVRDPILQEIHDLLLSEIRLDFHNQNIDTKMQIILDITSIYKDLMMNRSTMEQVEFHNRRLLFLLHTTRYKAIVDSK